MREWGARWSVAVAAVVVMASGAVAHSVPARRTTAVVADVGAGVNPYHQAFRRPGWTKPPAKAVRLDLTLGADWAKSRSADAKKWAAYRSNVLYWVPGTNLLLYTERSPGVPPDGRAPVQDHGTATAAAVGESCRDCWVLAVQDALLTGAAVRRIAAGMPWVDVVVSTTMNGDNLGPTFAGAVRDLDASGRFFVAGSGNTPVTPLMNPHPFPYYALPPEVVLVGGSHEACRAAEAQAGRPTEFTGDYSQILPLAGSVTATGGSHGTSFSAPKVAGAFGRALVEVRKAKGAGRAPGYLWSGAKGTGYLADGRLTHTELRAAMATSARYFTTTEYVGFAGGLCNTPVPVSPTPWVELGWGHVGPAEGSRAAAFLLGRATPPEKPSAATAYMHAFDAARRALF